MTMWMVRAEVDGRHYQPFLEHGVVAIGWEDVGDLDQSKRGHRRPPAHGRPGYQHPAFRP